MDAPCELLNSIVIGGAGFFVKVDLLVLSSPVNQQCSETFTLHRPIVHKLPDGFENGKPPFFFSPAAMWGSTGLIPKW